MKITVVIPALNPDEAIRKTIVQLLEKGFERIIIVDDGSDSTHQTIFCGQRKIHIVLSCAMLET